MRRLSLSSIALLGLVAVIARERAPVPSPLRADESAAPAARTIASVDGPSAAKPKVPALPVAPKIEAFALPRELDRYRELAAKVFLTGDEKADRAKLIRNPALLRAGGRRLLVPIVPAADLAREQDAALALLLEARRAGESVATEVLTEIVRDGQVENASLPKDVRAHLAGLKAEVLYEWSADSPESEVSLAAMLPGPISRQLWENVRTRQRSNLAESAAENVESEH